MHAHELDEPPVPTLLTPHPAAAAQGVARVLELPRPGCFCVDHEGARREAKRAASCLLEPELGDLVWIAGQAGAGFYVLSVLERASDGPAQLRVDGSASLHATGGLELRGDAGLTLLTPAKLQLSGDEVAATGRVAELAFTDLRAYVRTVFASLARVTRVGEVLELFVERFTQRSKHSVRAIEGVDQTSADTIKLEAKTAASLSSKHALVTGEKLVKLDGGQIHLG